METEKLTSGQLLIAALGILFFAVILSAENNSSPLPVSRDAADIREVVLPAEGMILPIQWGDIGKVMVAAGVIDSDKFESLYVRSGGLDDSMKKLLYGEYNGTIIMDEQNSGYLLNLLWAFGLSNKNLILEDGPMQDGRYGGAGRFASTGGWTLADGSAMDHFSKHAFVILTKMQQELVEKVSRNIYRPCCNNSTYFPDCNHGMAMLGLLELLASQGVSEEEMYKIALQVNAYWFPDTYLTIAKYFEMRGLDWNEVNPKEILGSAYSSASGYMRILEEVEPAESKGGGSCGV